MAHDHRRAGAAFLDRLTLRLDPLLLLEWKDEAFTMVAVIYILRVDVEGRR